MKVKELIAKLQEFDGDIEIFLCNVFIGHIEPNHICKMDVSYFKTTCSEEEVKTRGEGTKRNLEKQKLAIERIKKGYGYFLSLDNDR